MKESEAVRLCSMIGAAWRTTFADETKLLWSGALLPFDYDTSLIAVRGLAGHEKFCPSLAVVLAAIKDEAETQRLDERPALTEGDGMTLVEFLEANPEFAERLQKIGVRRG